MQKQFPLDIVPLTDEEDKIVKKYYKDYTRRFLRVGPQGYFSTPGYADHAADIYNLEVRPDDVWVTTFSRSGTTWLQELVWLVANDLDFEKTTNEPFTKRYAYIEYPTQASDITKIVPTNPSHRATFDDFRTLPNMTSPRFLKSHLPLSCLPPNLLDTAKVFYIARDIRDVAVSFHFAHKLFRYFDDDVTFKEFWDLFKNNLILHTPIFPHVQEAWSQRNHPNLMFLFYEEMQNDLPDVIDRVCTFLGREYSKEQKEKLASHLSFENMKKGPKLAQSSGQNEKTFFRKGKSGGWVEYFDDEMKKEAEEYIQRNLEKTDMRYPTTNK
ncbi:sulfotransferase 1 family member D1 isoform X2 [Manduca sexta]|nr:sulfotransferase 1 family member D1 isoform X2 [Manduca sexta]KAG6452148.1 hypothetical protein O3G_MSEX007490 [Manduca sexta]